MYTTTRGLRDLHAIEHGAVDVAEPSLETRSNDMEWDDDDEDEDHEENIFDSEVESEEGHGGDGEGSGENIVDDALAGELVDQLIMDDDSEPDVAPDVAEETTEAEPLAKRHRAEEPSASSSSAHAVDPVSRKKVYTSPQEILLPLSPPGCVLSLSYNDHRFKATWKKHIKCEFWIDELANMSFSSSFAKKDWKECLCLVHANAWEKWEIAKGTTSEVKLPRGMKPQKPGVISEAVFDLLTPVIADMPPAKQYVR